MEIAFVKMNPTENMTILVESPLPREQYGQIAARLMAYGSLFAEQVGYIEKPTLKGARSRLHMMGGEFCGNATMSTAALIAFDDGVKGGDTVTVPLEVSGAEGLLTCEVCPVAGEEKTAAVSVGMPPVLGVEKRTFQYDGASFETHMVRTEGITHLLIDTARDKQKPWHSIAEGAIIQWNEELKADALGLMLYETTGESYRIDPLVYVEGSKSLTWERGCGSGTAAMGAWLAWKNKSTTGADIDQPGGRIKVEAEYRDNAVGKITIRGIVKLAARGIAYL
ncbi:histidine racemase CntK [Spirochaetia bacterium]|nr:histidine racemase CntK [Spirochaetia bacterium]